MLRAIQQPARLPRLRAAGRFGLADCFQTLEPRQMMSITSPSPADGMDYHFVLAEEATTPVISATPDPVARHSLPDGFTWFDGTANARLLAHHPGDFQKIVVDGYSFWPINANGVGVNKHGDTSESRTRSFARVVKNQTNVLVIDIEEWAIDLRGATAATVTQSINRFKQVLGWIREEAPNLKLGIYGYLSISDSAASIAYEVYNDIAVSTDHPWYKANLSKASEWHADWQAASEYLQPLADSVDYVFPSIYTGSSNVGDWMAYAKTLIADSRRFGKPVIPFIWPQYHDSVPNLGLQYISPEFWQTQINYVRQEADGAVIWLGTGTAFDPNASWVNQLVTMAARDSRGATASDDGGSSGGSETVGGGGEALSGGGAMATTGPSESELPVDVATDSLRARSKRDEVETPVSSLLLSKTDHRSIFATRSLIL